ncbi:PadR family transcriptional regulator [Arsenicicoccus dermatophilus]|uniref:PadR family transcriptional regulator n=1 Tax=Arsenicicoccus dermatophilus TaxID=1076331 RepID=UPI0039173E07
MGSERQAQWLRGVLDLAVLAVLDREGEAYGYSLLQALDRAGLPDLKGGTIYPLLSRLERDGLVASSWRAGESGPARKYFTVTADGRRALGAGIAGWTDFTETITAILSSGARRSR